MLWEPFLRFSKKIPLNLAKPEVNVLEAYLGSDIEYNKDSISASADRWGDTDNNWK